MGVAPVSVGVVCMSGGEGLTRCLAALREQCGAPPFEVVVVSDPRLGPLDDVRDRFPEVRFVTNDGQRTSLELASRALRECRGALVLLTKDWCVPDRNWVRAMIDAQRESVAAVGGRVEVAPDASAVDWAYYFVDFHRYGESSADGPAEALTVCNVAYNRRRLEAIRPLWEHAFVETAINDALRARFGSLWLERTSRVTFCRRLTLRDAVRERYAFGRLFGCSRLRHCGPGRRLVYIVGGPAVPFLLLARIARAATRSRREAGMLLRSCVPLIIIVLGRSWGEWLGYITGRPPRSAVMPS